MPQISIIMPIYNAEKFINYSINDLINQTLLDIEIIAINDGSKDNTGKILDEFALKDSRIKVIHKENGGAPSARNCGLGVASGEYVGFMDADDRVDPELFEILYNAARSSDSDVAACNFIQEFTDKIIIDKHHENIPQLIVYNGREECIKSIDYAKHALAPYTWNKIYRRSLIGDLRFCEDLKIVDDCIFTYHYMANAKRACFIDLPLCHYRYVMSGLTKGSKTKVFLHELERIDELIEWCSVISPEACIPLKGRYLFYNTKACDAMLKCFDPKMYKVIQKNISKYEDHIPLLSKRPRILVSAAYSSWHKYKIVGYVYIFMKRVYIFMKRIKK